MADGGAGLWVMLAGLVLGAAFSVVARLSHFCVMGCISDAALFGSFRRFRVWLLAVAVALAGSQAADAAGLIDLGGSMYRTPQLFWLGAVLGGLLQGFGMVLAGGCASRNVVLLGSGSLKALVTLLVMGMVVHAATLGVLAPLTAGLRAVGSIDIGVLGAADQDLPSLIAVITGFAPGPIAFVLTLLIAGTLFAFCFKDAGFRRSRVDVAAGSALGVLITGGWLVTSWLGDEATPPASLNYVLPAADSLHYLMAGGGYLPSFGVAVIIGTILGSAVVSTLRRQWRLEVFVARDDMIRHLVGGALMGVGGALALGCTIGQGLTGVATLSAGSWLTVGGLIAGGWWGIRYLETGRLLPFLPLAGSAGRTPVVDLDLAPQQD